MRVALIFPPATDPRAPQLALPSLAAALRREGIETSLYDLNVSGLEHVTRKDYLRAASRRIRERATAATDPRLLRLANASEHLAEVTEDAVRTLRSPKFFEAFEYVAARDTLTGALDLVGAAAGRPVAYNVAPIRYDVEGVDTRSLRDLIRGTADDEGCVFAEHWKEEIFPLLARESPDLVGITITNRQQILPGLMLARALKARGHFVVLGGTLYTKFAAKLAARPAFFEHFANAVVVYEGETALLELVHHLATDRDFSRIPNLIYPDGGRLVSTPHHVEDVDQLLTPDFAGLPLDRYLAPALVLPILTGKGCYFNRCKFCDIPHINHIASKAYRVRAVEKIAGDVRTLSERFATKNFLITDEALSPRLLLKLAEELERDPSAHYAFTGYARLEDGFTPDVCRTLARMGMRKIFFGLESASQKTLDHMDKGIDMHTVPKVLESCREAEIDFHIFSIVGFPEEDEASARETFRFFAEHVDLIEKPGNSFDIHPFGLELRTAYFEECDSMGVSIDAGALAKDFVIGLSSREWNNGHGLTKQEASRLIEEFNRGLKRAYRRFHNIPLHLWPGFEEYAVLYAEHYRRRIFPYRTCLPDGSDPGRFRVRFSSAFARSEGENGKLVFTHPGASFVISRAAERVLSLERPRSARELFFDLLPAVAEDERQHREAQLRERIEELIGAGLLQVELLPE